MSTERLIERISDWRSGDLSVDRSVRVVQNIALAGVDSRNGYRYSEEALKAAVPLYENRPVFLDHAVNARQPWERSARDLVGAIRRVRYEAGRVRGDIEVLDTESGRTFLALVESNTTAVGMSHVVLAARSADKRLVERIEEVISVDAVVFPATTMTFQEQQQMKNYELPIPDSYETCLQQIDQFLADLEEPVVRVATFADSVVTAMTEPEPEVEAETAAELYQVRAWQVNEGEMEVSEVVAEISREELESGAWRKDMEAASDAVLPESLQSRGRLRKDAAKNLWQQKYQRLLQKYVTLNRRQQQNQQVEKLIQEACLPEEAVTAEFRQLLQESAGEQRRMLIEERKKLWRMMEQRTPRSVRRLNNETGGSDAVFIRGIKGGKQEQFLLD